MKRRVKTAESKFIQASKDIRDFEVGQSEFICPSCKQDIAVHHEEIFDEYRELVVKREAARTKAIEVAREEGIGICGMNVIPTTRRKYDGEAIYNYLEDQPNLRDNIVKVKYVISTDDFDDALAKGKIPTKMRKKFVKEEVEAVTVQKQPAEIKLA